MRTDLVLDALRMALGLRGPGADVELVHHSDRGSQPELKRSSQHGLFAERIVALWSEVLVPVVSVGVASAIAQAA